MAFTQPFPNGGYPSDDLNRKFTLIRDYLEGTNSSAKHTAKEITTLAKDISSLEINESLESRFSLEGFLWGLWAEMVDLIIEVPHSHPWQDRMVELLSAIKEVPRQVTPGMEELEWTWGKAFWQDLPIFGAEVRELWNQGPWEEIPDGIFAYRGDAPFPPDVWASLNAFTARITVASVLNFETYAIWILRHTLEEERTNEEVDDNLPAAAMWIIYAGQIVYHNAAKDYTDSTETHRPDIQSLRIFSKPFSKGRWNFWKERFEFFRNHEVLKQITRDSAGEALGKMVEIERRHPEPKESKGPALPPSGTMTAVHIQGISGAE